MIFTILESRLVDILLIGIALYFIFPGLFKRNNARSNSASQPSEKVTYHNAPTSKEDNKKGEYIDYEEIK